MTRLAVTGAAGRIGSKAVPRLRDAGFEVVELVRNPAQEAGWTRPVDLVDEAAVVRELDEARPDVVLHLAAALPSPAATRDDRAMAQSIARAAERTGVSRIVFASSASVYGDRADEALSETRPPNPRSPYAVAKIAAEEVFAASPVESLTLRIFNVFGPGLEHSLVAKLCEATPDHPFEPVAIDSFVRDYVHLDDILRTLVTAVDVDLPQPHTVVNVGSGQRLSTRQLIEALERFRPVHFVPRQGEPSWSWADTTLMQRVLGFSADSSLKRFDPDSLTVPAADR